MGPGLRAERGSAQRDGNTDLAGATFARHKLRAQHPGAIDTAGGGRRHANRVLAVAHRFVARDDGSVVGAYVGRDSVDASDLHRAGVVGPGRGRAALDRLSGGGVA